MLGVDCNVVVIMYTKYIFCGVSRVVYQIVKYCCYPFSANMLVFG